MWQSTFRGPLNPAAGLAAAFALFLLLATRPLTASADGALPPLPYRYLHPPPALSAGNKPPLSINKTVATSSLASAQLRIFTRDGQIGLIAPVGALTASAGTSVRISIAPVESPPGVPGLYVVDGNAYQLSLQSEPGNGRVTFAKRASVVFRWPHIPTAVFTYTGSAWKRICYSDQGVLAGFTLSCRIRSAGIYAAVAPPSTTILRVPNTPIAHSRFAWLDPYIPILAAAAVLIGTSLLVYAVAWPRRGARRSR